MPNRRPAAGSFSVFRCGALAPGKVPDVLIRNAAALAGHWLFGERHLRHVINEFIAHYHRERFHQGLGGQLIEARAGSTSEKGARSKVVCRSRLGGC